MSGTFTVKTKLSIAHLLVKFRSTEKTLRTQKYDTIDLTKFDCVFYTDLIKSSARSTDRHETVLSIRQAEAAADEEMS